MAHFRQLITGRGPQAQAFLEALGLDGRRVMDLTLHFSPEQVVTATVTLAVDEEQGEALLSELQSRSYALIELLDTTDDDTEPQAGVAASPANPVA